MGSSLFYPPRNFGAIPAAKAELETARVVIIPVPYDSTVEGRGGSRDGPLAIIDASQDLELYDPELDQEIFQVGIHTFPEVAPVMSNPQDMVDRVYEVAKNLLQKDRLLVMLGGEHSLTLGMVQAYRQKYPDLSVLHLDAHADLRDRYLGTSYGHASVMRRVWEVCPVVPVGVRSLSREEREFIQEKGLAHLYSQPLPLSPQAVDRIISALSPQVYITIDLDVFDPSLMAAVGIPEPGGLGWQEALALLRAVSRRHQVVGFDLVELSPREGPNACAYLAAKLAYKLMGYATQPWPT